MACISIIESKKKVLSALDLLANYPTVHFDVTYTDDGKLLLNVKHEDYYQVCDFLKDLYGADLITDNWKGEI